jgi:putative phage-type endonuclease
VSLTAEQIAERAKGLGGSDAAAALGLSKWKTARQLYAEKRGEIAIEIYDEEAIWWGNALEPIVRQKYAETTGYTVRLPQRTLWHPVHDFMCAHIDGFVDDPKRGYEGKTAFRSTGWGEQDTDQIPTEYLLQVQHYMIVTELPVFDVAVLIGRKFAYYEVPAPDAELREMIVEGERDFMRRVREGDPPPIDFDHSTSLDLVKKLYPGTNGERILANEALIQLRARIQETAELEAAAKLEKERCRARMLDAMGENAVLAFPDGKAFRRKLISKDAYSVEATEYMDGRFVNDPGVANSKSKSKRKAA